MTWQQVRAWAVIAGICPWGACTFTPLALPSDGPLADGNPNADAMSDANGTVAPSCNALHTADPGLPSGIYTIDPDGLGGDAPLSVTCDMTAADGGWTIIFFAPTINLTAAPSAYTASTPRLLTDAQSVLLSYRTSTQVATGNYAVFDFPSAWRTTPPFGSAATDVMLPVSIDGGTATVSMLRYGRESFGNHCEDAWDASTMTGRICIAGTTAPFFNGFVSPNNDKCPDSLSYWYAANCTNDVRFSMAVR